MDKALERKHNLICVLYKWALTYYLTKRCLIMGFRTKPASITALQSTFLCRSADPSLGVPWDGSYDLAGLLKTPDFTRVVLGGGTCHQIQAHDLNQQQRQRRVRERNILRCLGLSLDLQAARTNTRRQQVCGSVTQKKAPISEEDGLVNQEPASGRCPAVRRDLSEERTK